MMIDIDVLHEKGTEVALSTITKGEIDELFDNK